MSSLQKHWRVTPSLCPRGWMSCWRELVESEACVCLPLQAQGYSTVLLKGAIDTPLLLRRKTSSGLSTHNVNVFNHFVLRIGTNIQICFYESIAKLKIRSKTATPTKLNRVTLNRWNQITAHDVVGSFEVGRPDGCWDCSVLLPYFLFKQLHKARSYSTPWCHIRWLEGVERESLPTLTPSYPLLDPVIIFPFPSAPNL